MQQIINSKSEEASTSKEIKSDWHSQC